MPLQIGARDVAFPRLNAFSFWVFLAGAIILNLGWFMHDGAPNGGWFGYTPLTTRTFSPSHAIDMWVMGLQLLGVASIAASLNFIVTIINLRAPGMTMMRLPVFTWMTLVTAFLIVLAVPGDHDRARRADDGPALRDQLLRGVQRRHADPLDRTCSGSSATRRSTS